MSAGLMAESGWRRVRLERSKGREATSRHREPGTSSAACRKARSTSALRSESAAFVLKKSARLPSFTNLWRTALCVRQSRSAVEMYAQNVESLSASAIPAAAPKPLEAPRIKRPAIHGCFHLPSRKSVCLLYRTYFFFLCALLSR